MERFEAVVVGAGVVGLAIARALALRGVEVLVLEAEDDIATHTSARSSEVVHAGIYYPPSSLKARLCRRGNAELYAYCHRRSVAHRKLGKLIVATDLGDRERLEALARNAERSGVHDLRWLSQAQLRTREPEVRGVAALESPSTGIVDSHGLVRALQADAEGLGATVVTRARFERAVPEPGGFEVVAVDTRLRTRMLVNAAGLWASDVAGAIEGLAPATIARTHRCKGNYFRLPGRSPFRHLVYPIPDRDGLGVHVTLDLEGNARFGPDVEWIGDAGTGTDYAVDVTRREHFARAIARYAPRVDPRRLEPAFAGIRPKLNAPGTPPADFVVSGPADHGLEGLVNLYGIESPGLTACLPLADAVAAVLEARV